MPNWLQAVVLGVVQGLTEFFPVSSDGHLIIVLYLTRWHSPGLAFDVALHMGTFGAVLLFFRGELLAMTAAVLGRRGADAALYRRLALLIALATVPVAVVGLLAKEAIETVLRSPLVAGVGLLITAASLLIGERLRDRRIAAGAAAPAEAMPRATRAPATGSGVAVTSAASPPEALPAGEDAADPTGRSLREVRVRDALAAGLVQPLALLAGVSRSGTTIPAAVGSGLTREAATRFSFLMSVPALIGAFVINLGDLADPGPYSGAEMAAGVLAAFLAGYAAIRFLLRLVARERLTIFAVYCVGAAAVTFLAYAVIGPATNL